MGKSREDKMEEQCSIKGVVCELHCIGVNWNWAGCLFLNVSKPEKCMYL